MLEIALVENIQRKDLTAFEEAEALHSLSHRCGYTHEDLAKRLGKSRTSITESLSLTSIPPDIRKVCRLADISSKSILLQVARQGDPKKMLALVEKIAASGATREQLRKEQDKPRPGRPKAYVFSFRPRHQGVQPAADVRQEERVEGRSHRRARSHPRRAPQQLNQARANAGAAASELTARRQLRATRRHRGADSSSREPASLPPDGDKLRGLNRRVSRWRINHGRARGANDSWAIEPSPERRISALSGPCPDLV